MGSIRTRSRSDGSTYWQVSFRHDNKQTSESFDSAAKAERWNRLLKQVGPEQARALLKRPTAKDVPTLSEWLTHHLEHATGITAGTRGEYERLAARSWQPTLGDFPIDMIEKDQVRLWVLAYGEKKSPKTVANAQGLLSTVFASAIEKGYRPDNPAKGVGLPDALREEMVFLTTGEFARLLSYIPLQWHPLVETIAGTGMRWGEVTALMWRNVDLDATDIEGRPAPHLWVRQAWKRGEHGSRELGTPKTKRSRRQISLTPAIVNSLRPLRGDPGDLVFRAKRGGKLHHQVWHPRVWTPAVSRFAGDVYDEAGKLVKKGTGKRPRIHDLRHSHVAWLAAGGAMPGEIQHRLGHESIKTTMDVYGHLFPGSQARMAAIISLALTNAMPEIED